jgi:hypothetical protein
MKTAPKLLTAFMNAYSKKRLDPQALRPVWTRQVLLGRSIMLF